MRLPPRPRAVVTGGASGLGRALCLELARRAARLVVADLHLPGAEQTAADVRAAGGEAQAVVCDVADPGAVEALAKEAEQSLGAVDLLVNNAGVATAGAVGDAPLEDWRWVVGVNLWGVVHGCHFFVPAMKRRRAGAILNVASAAGLVAFPEMGAYNVTKAGVIALSETLRSELAPYRIDVSVLCPTFFATNIHNSSRSPDTWQRDFVEREMRKARIDAAGVAATALRGLEGGALHIIPQADGRFAWRLKRLWPRALTRLNAAYYAKLRKRYGLAD